MSYDVIARESTLRHGRAFPGDDYVYPELDPGGLYQWRARGEQHAFDPESVSKLRNAVRRDSYATFREQGILAGEGLAAGLDSTEKTPFCLPKLPTGKLR